MNLRLEAAQGAVLEAKTTLRDVRTTARQVEKDLESRSTQPEYQEAERLYDMGWRAGDQGTSRREFFHVWQIRTEGHAQKTSWSPCVVMEKAGIAYPAPALTTQVEFAGKTLKHLMNLTIERRNRTVPPVV